MGNRADRFLEQYKALEELLARKYADDPRRHSSVIMEFLNDPESIPVREELNLCREIRNLLAHRAEVDGEPVLEPAQSVIELMDDIIGYANRPPLAREFATPISRMMVAGMNKKVLPLMREMEERGFSHVPVIEKGEFVGVFSISSVFSYILEWKDPIINEQTTVYNFRKFLPIKRHHSEQFLFMDMNATYPDVKVAFEDRHERSRRLVAIFLTETGDEKEPLLGMVTPWDVLGKKLYKPI